MASALLWLMKAKAQCGQGYIRFASVSTYENPASCCRWKMVRNLYRTTRHNSATVFIKPTHQNRHEGFRAVHEPTVLFHLRKYRTAIIPLELQRQPPNQFFRNVITNSSRAFHTLQTGSAPCGWHGIAWFTQTFIITAILTCSNARIIGNAILVDVVICRIVESFILIIWSGTDFLCTWNTNENVFKM